MSTKESRSAKVTTESYHVPTSDPGIRLYIRNKRPKAKKIFPPEKIVLFVHGGTFPSESTFDLQLDGLSWMDYIVQHGYDVYLMDVRGYGRSTRPPEMNKPALANKPIVHTELAVKDFATVVDHILVRRNVSKINLFGWSWGTVITGAYTAENNDKVERLVLYAPLWLLETPSLAHAERPIGAYRTVTLDEVRQPLPTLVPPEKQKDLMPNRWFEEWWKANLDADPVGAAQNPPVVRAPNGLIEDNQRYWGANKPYYNPSKIRVPVLVVHGEWDIDTPAYMSQGPLARLTSSPFKRYVVINEGTHTIIMERSRLQLFREVQSFLDRV